MVLKTIVCTKCGRYRISDNVKSVLRNLIAKSKMDGRLKTTIEFSRGRVRKNILLVKESE